MMPKFSLAIFGWAVATLSSFMSSDFDSSGTLWIAIFLGAVIGITGSIVENKIDRE